MNKRKGAARPVAGVVGLGYVGLPLSMAFCEAGYRVVGVDVDAGKVSGMKKGRSPVEDVSDALLQKHLKSKAFEPTTQNGALAQAHAISICVPTPLRKSKDPDMSYVVDATEQIVPHLQRGQVIILESTVYPGATEEMVGPMLERSGLKVGKDFFLAFSPERVDPGNKRFGIRQIPKVVGGVTPKCTQKAAQIYQDVFETVWPVKSAKEAEMAKLLENTFRSVNIGLINELALVANKMGIDIWQVIEAAATKPFGFMPFYPGPGLGGHCLVGSEYVFVRDNGQLQMVPLQDLFARFKEGDHEGLVLLNKDLQALAWDPETGRSAWKPITMLSRRRYRGCLLHIKTQLGRTLTVTDKHPMLARGDKGWQVKLADQLQVGDELPLVASYPAKAVRHRIDLIEELQRSNNAALYQDVRVKPRARSFSEFKGVLYGELQKLGISYDIKQEYIRLNYLPLALYLQVEDKLSITREELCLYTGKGRITLIPAVIPLNHDFLRLLGYYTAEGCLTHDKTTRMRLTFHRREVELIKDVTSTLERLGIKHSIFDDAKCQSRHIKASSRVLGWLLAEVFRCGRGSYSARIPRLVFHLEPKGKRAFLAGLFRGDGWVEVQGHSPVIGFGTCNDVLAEEVCLLLQSLGIMASRKLQNAQRQTKPLQILRVFGADQVGKLLDLLSREKRTRVENALERQKKAVHRYHFEKADDHFSLKVASIQKEPCADELVYSMEVEDLHTFTTSSGLVVHNCIPIDPFYLSWKAKMYAAETGFIELAGRVNGKMPEYVVERVAELLNERGKALNGASVLVLGVAYKRNVSDIRESPALDVLGLLVQRKAKVQYHDPHVPSLEYLGKTWKSAALSKAVLAQQDCVIVVTDHGEFDYGQVAAHAKLVFDTRNATQGLRKAHKNVHVL